MILEFKEGLHRNLQRLSDHLAVSLEGECSDPSVRSNILILFANRFLQLVDFDMTGQLCQFFLLQGSVIVSEESFQESGCETSR